MSFDEFKNWLITNSRDFVEQQDLQVIYLPDFRISVRFDCDSVYVMVLTKSEGHELDFDTFTEVIDNLVENQLETNPAHLEVG